MNKTDVPGKRNEQKGILKLKFAVLVTVISVLSLGITIDCFAQGGMNRKGNGGWGTEGQYGKLYNPKTVETIVGEVISVGKIIPSKGMSNGVHLMVKTNKETVSVHLGPEWYIKKQVITVKNGDRIEVKGSRITFEGKPAIIAAQVKKGNETLELRNDSGLPVWSGRKQR